MQSLARRCDDGNIEQMTISAQDEGAPLQRDAENDETFSAAVAAVTSAFGDATRRQIYLVARDGEGVTATEIARRFALHPNVARHHLDKLAAGGYLDVSLDHTPSGAGRPSKRYRRSARQTTLESPPRPDELMITLLVRALSLLEPAVAEKMALEVGEDYGRMLAAQMSPGESQRSSRAAMLAVADALTAHGFAAHAEERAQSMSIIRDHCPFGEIVAEHPVLCAVDRGMVEGLMAGLCGEGVPVQLRSRARGDDNCESVAAS